MFAYCNNNPIIAKDPTGRFLGVLIGIGVGLALLLSGCDSDSNKKDYGAARPYKYSNSRDYNCYAYALGETVWKYVGGSQDAVTDYNVNDVAKLVLKDAERDGRTMRIIDSYNSDINANEYRIALRVGAADYHFMRQNDDGTWSHKPGFCDTRCIKGDNPDAVTWDQPIVDARLLYYGIVRETGVIENYYSSNTIYFAVTVDTGR